MAFKKWLKKDADAGRRVTFLHYCSRAPSGGQIVDKSSSFCVQITRDAKTEDQISPLKC